MGIDDTSPCGTSVATEHAAARGRPPAPASPRTEHLRGIIWLIRLPLVYSVSRYDGGDVKFLNFSKRAAMPATFTYSLML